MNSILIDVQLNPSVQTDIRIPQEPFVVQLIGHYDNFHSKIPTVGDLKAAIENETGIPSVLLTIINGDDDPNADLIDFIEKYNPYLLISGAPIGKVNVLVANDEMELLNAQHRISEGLNWIRKGQSPFPMRWSHEDQAQKQNILFSDEIKKLYQNFDSNSFDLKVMGTGKFVYPISESTVNNR